MRARLRLFANFIANIIPLRPNVSQSKISMLTHTRYLSKPLSKQIYSSLFIVAFITTLVVFADAQNRNRPRSSKLRPTARLQWSGEPGISRYRLQLARDEQFTDVVFDRAVTGLDYVVKDLPSGNYYWRVASAPSDTRAYSTPAPVQISTSQTAATLSARTPIATKAIATTPTVANAARPSAATSTATKPIAAAPIVKPAATPDIIRERVLQPPENVGWRTATGDISQPLAAHLRDAVNYDLVGVNAEGTVYALNGTNGVALWTTGFMPQVRRGEATGNKGAAAFAPVIIASAQKPLANLLVAFEGGVRSLEGATGRELWRAPISGRAASGVSFDLDDDGTPEIILVDDSAPSLVVLNSDTGGILSQTKLDGSIVGAPAALNTGSERSIVLAFANGIVDVRNIKGTRLRTIKLDASITTAPIVLQMANAASLLVGTDKGLIALNAGDLRPLWRVATDKADAPRGSLAVADLDGDGASEVLMITRSSRAVAINISSGKIKWYTDGATDAASVAFADLNGDKSLDVILAAVPSFAIGLNGRDGSLIWRADEIGQARQQGSTDSATRALITAPVNANSSFVVGTDPSHIGLRAVGLPQGTVGAVNH